MSERCIGSASNIVAGQASFGSTATEIVAARTGRRSVTIRNDTSGTMCAIGANSSVTTSSGFRLVAGGSLTVETEAAIWAISVFTGSINSNVDFIET